MPLSFVSGHGRTFPAAVAPSGAVTLTDYLASDYVAAAATERATSIETVTCIGTHTLKLQWPTSSAWTNRQARNDIRAYVGGILAATLTSADSSGVTFDVDNGETLQFKWTPSGTVNAIAEWDQAEIYNTSDSDAWVDCLYFAWFENAAAVTGGNKHWLTVGEQNHFTSHWTGNQTQRADGTTKAARTGGGGSTNAVNLGNWTATGRRFDTEAYTSDGTENIVIFSFYMAVNESASPSWVNGGDELLGCRLSASSGSAGYWDVDLDPTTNSFGKAQGGWDGGASREATFLFITKPDANGWFRVCIGFTDLDNLDAPRHRFELGNNLTVTSDSEAAYACDFMVNVGALSGFEVAT